MGSLLLVRHGQASFGGNYYDVLSDIGERQALATGQWLRDRGSDFDRIMSGPRRRQIETAEIIRSAALFKSESLETVAGLDEFGEGEEILNVAEQLFGLQLIGTNSSVPRKEVLRLYSKAYLAWFHGEVNLKGRDSFPKFREKVSHWLRQQIEQSRISGQKSLAITSAGVISAVVCEVFGLPDKHWPNLIGVVDNASMTEILYSGSRMGIRHFNSTAHLSEELLSAI